MGKFDIPGVTKSRFASIQDGEEWSQQIQESEWYKSRFFVNKIEIVLWIRLALLVLENQIRASKISNFFANDGELQNNGIETGSLKDFVVEAGTQEKQHRNDMKEAHFEFQKDVINDHKKNTAAFSTLFFFLKNGVKYSYLIINALIIAFIIGICCHNYNRSQVIAELKSVANADIAPAWYEPGQKTYESVSEEYKEGMLMQFGGEMSNGYKFEMTLCVDNGKASGAYIYKSLEQINRNLPPQGENESDVYSNFKCAALRLKGKVDGDISKPGKVVSINLTEYNNSNRKIGSFKGKGRVDGDKHLYIEGTFKNHEGQKNKFFMTLDKSVFIESFSNIINGMLTRKSIHKVLLVRDNDNPFAIVVTKNKDIRMLKYIDAFTDYDTAVKSSTPYYGTYDKNRVSVIEDCLILRTPSKWETYSNGNDNYIKAECVKIIDFRGDSPNDISIDGVIWDDSKWETDKKFYTISTDNQTSIKCYNQFGKKLSDTILPIFHTIIPSPGIIKGDIFGEDSVGNAILVSKIFDFDGNELE